MNTTLPRPSFASAFQAPKDVARPKSIFLYGTHGTRKTSIAASISLVPGFDKVLLIDVDNGAEALMNRPELRERVEGGNIDVLQISSLDESAKDKVYHAIKEVCDTDFGYDAVILDTLDVAQDAAEKDIKKQYAGTKNTFGVFGDLGIWTDEVTRMLHECPHLTGITTCHSKEQTAESGAHRILPRLSGSSKDAIGGTPSIVAYLEWQQDPETGEQHLVANVGESSTIISKNRYGLPNQLIDPDMPMIYSLITQATATNVTEKIAA